MIMNADFIESDRKNSNLIQDMIDWWSDYSNWLYWL